MFKLEKLWLAFDCFIAEFLGMNLSPTLNTSFYWSHFSFLRPEQGILLISSLGRSLHPLCISVANELMVIRITKESKTRALRSLPTVSLLSPAHTEELLIPTSAFSTQYILSTAYELRQVGLTEGGLCKCHLRLRSLTSIRAWIWLKPFGDGMKKCSCTRCQSFFFFKCREGWLEEVKMWRTL